MHELKVKETQEVSGGSHIQTSTKTIIVRLPNGEYVEVAIEPILYNP